MAGTKKGNVDTDIVFEMMKRLVEPAEDEKLILVSGDGDYKKLGSEYYDYLENVKKLLSI